MTSPRCVLLIEDDADVRDTMTRILELSGYQVLPAAGGPAALSLLRAGARPSLILLDLMMPEMSGWAFRAELEGDPSLSALPIVVVTARRSVGLEQSVQWARELVYKPFALATLLEVVDRHAEAARGDG